MDLDGVEREILALYDTTPLQKVFNFQKPKFYFEVGT